jgi:hypothetical protein
MHGHPGCQRSLCWWTASPTLRRTSHKIYQASDQTRVIIGLDSTRDSGSRLHRTTNNH